MNVRELIKILQEADPEAVVVMANHPNGGGYAELDGRRILMGDEVAWEEGKRIHVVDPPEEAKLAVVFYPL